MWWRYPRSQPLRCLSFRFFFFNDTATTEIYTLSLHDALPIFAVAGKIFGDLAGRSALILGAGDMAELAATCLDRKSTRLNSSHGYISYAVFCLKKKKRYRKSIALTLTQQSSRMPGSPA